MTDVNSGEYFVKLLESVSGVPETNASSTVLANRAWDAWEEQGVSRGSDTDQVINRPDKIFKNYYSDIIKANQLKSENIHFCLAKTRALTAYANTTKNGDYVVVFDSELYAFINSVVITCIVCVYSKPTDEEVDFYFEHIYDMLLQFKGFPASKPLKEQGDDFLTIISKDYDLTMLGSYCGAAIYAYILCHEIGHHILGHTQGGKVNKMIYTQSSKQNLAFNNTNHKQEFDADEIGFVLFNNVTKNNENLTHLKLNHQFTSLPLVLFKLLELSNLISTTSSETHPEPLARFSRLEQYKNSLGLHEDTEFYEALMEVFSGLFDWVKNKEISQENQLT